MSSISERLKQVPVLQQAIAQKKAELGEMKENTGANGYCWKLDRRCAESLKWQRFRSVEG